MRQDTKAYWEARLKESESCKSLKRDAKVKFPEREVKQEQLLEHYTRDGSVGPRPGRAQPRSPCLVPLCLQHSA